jgi:hypothetical protein
MSFATFFLSAGRCGTQWLAKNLQDAYGDLAVVTHEPIKRDYNPRRLLGLRDPKKLKPYFKTDFAAVIARHVDAIEEHLKTYRYIECGWPCYGALRSLAERLAGRIRIVHLTRHPVPSAMSMLTHSYYHKTFLGKVEYFALLTPSDAGISFPEYRDRWQEMNRLEKCLYFWAEVNTLGLVLERELGIPWLRIKSEDLFEADGLDRLLDFLELPRREQIYVARVTQIDAWRHFTSEAIDDTKAIARHPKIMAVAIMLGYEPLSFDLSALRQRYAKRSLACSTDAPASGSAAAPPRSS